MGFLFFGGGGGGWKELTPWIFFCWKELIIGFSFFEKR